MSARAEFQTILWEYQEEATIAGGQAAVEQISAGMIFNFVDKDALKYMEDNASELSRSTLERLQGNLDEKIAQGLAEGKAQKAIVKDLNTIFDNMATWESERIARTEVARGVVNGSLLGYKQMDVEIVEWVTNEGSCELCDAMQGELMSIEEAMGSIPLHPNCYCFWIPRPDLNKKPIIPEVPKEPKVPITKPKAKPKPSAEKYKYPPSGELLDELKDFGLNSTELKIPLARIDIGYMRARYFGTSASFKTNGALRGTVKLTSAEMEFQKEIVKRMSTAIDKSFVKNNIVAYRGIAANFPEIKVGEVFIDKGFMSTSFHKKHSLVNFAKDGKLMEIHIPKGTRALYEYDVLKKHSELELVLQKETKLRKISEKVITESGKTYSVDIMEVIQ